MMTLLENASWSILGLGSISIGGLAVLCLVVSSLLRSVSLAVNRVGLLSISLHISLCRSKSLSLLERRLVVVVLWELALDGSLWGICLVKSHLGLGLSLGLWLVGSVLQLLSCHRCLAVLLL